MAPSRHRHPDNPRPILALDLSRRSEAYCRPADLPTCRFWSLVTTGAPLAHSLQATAQAFPGPPQALVSSLQAPATVQRPVPVLALGTIRHPSSPPLSLKTARHQIFPSLSNRSASSSNSQPFPIKIATKQSSKKFQESQAYI